jgi:7,8-dihydropterin-6-yl-methyl-4-(beta-D-ribofuranosyl)aminobenzene 5'-phosphate synthase
MRKFLNSHLAVENWKNEITIRFRTFKQFQNAQEELVMKKHKFWAWATIFCFLLTLLTGYEHK